jgi:glycosyltransferase involved in cell wall biosynthesis
MRYAWLSDVDRDRVGGVQGRALSALGGWLRRTDYAAAQRVGSFVTVSSALAERIRRCYGREATVIHPPVDVNDFAIPNGQPRTGFLWAHRMVPYKRPLEVVAAFTGLDEHLTMVGVGPLHHTVVKRAPHNVNVHGWLERERFAEAFSRARAFIHLGEEDFGISMVEALAAGTPVIAVRRGGACDIVRDGVDGILLDEPTPEALRVAIREVGLREWDPQALRRRADRFSRSRFAEEFGRHVAALRTPKRPFTAA